MSGQGLQPAGVFRRTQAERDSEQLAWERSDQALFAAGACHVLAWTCRETYAAQSIAIGALRFPGDRHAFHVLAAWNEWTFDHCGWQRRSEVVAVNEAFEGRAIDWLDIDGDLAGFCADQCSRMPDAYWRNPLPRARSYLGQFQPPWTGGASAPVL